MGGEVLKNAQPEIKYSFDFPERALYVTHPEWNLRGINAITEDQRFVMGLSHSNVLYQPLPFETFKQSIEKLAARKALEIKPSFLIESIDYDRLEAPMLDMKYKYLLDLSGVLIRLRNDEKGVHTMSLFGQKNTLIEIAENISLPHPFDFGKYPYKSIFRDESRAEGKIKALD